MELGNANDYQWLGDLFWHCVKIDTPPCLIFIHENIKHIQQLTQFPNEKYVPLKQMKQ